MWIVRLALRRPYTFVVVGLLILILGALAIFRTPTDIFPDINIPVVSVLWSYAGLAPQETPNRIVSITERALTTTVNDIEHILLRRRLYASVLLIKTLGGGWSVSTLPPS